MEPRFTATADVHLVLTGEGLAPSWLTVGPGAKVFSLHTTVEEYATEAAQHARLVELGIDPTPAPEPAVTTEAAAVEPDWSAMTKSEIATYCQDTFGETLDTSKLKDELIARAHELWLIANS
jgi:hypothetical protein